MRADVLVNNVGVYPAGDILHARSGAFRVALETHFFGCLSTCRAFVPAVLEAGYGRVVNVSGGYSSFGEKLGGPAAYCASKAALNALTVKLAREVRGDVKVNAACPGWVRTRMGGPQATGPMERGADTIVRRATRSRRGPHGGFFRGRRRIPW
jgi:NAD(P)-dependent dehydrogenase (short-subunit alcohol dehydrogenase family)